MMMMRMMMMSKVNERSHCVACVYRASSKPMRKSCTDGTNADAYTSFNSHHIVITASCCTVCTKKKTNRAAVVFLLE